MANTQTWNDPDTINTKVNGQASGVYQIDPTTNKAVSPGAATDGANVTFGAQADAAAATDTGTFSFMALFKRLLQRFTTSNQDGLAPTSILAIGNYGFSSGGPVDSTGKPQSMAWDRLRTFQGKSLTGSNGNITATNAGDTNLTFSVAPKTILPGQLIQLTTNGSGTIEYVVVASSYTVSSSATVIPLANPVVNTGSNTAKWDVFAANGPAGGAMLPTGIGVFALGLQKAGGGSSMTVANNANAEGTTPDQVLAAQPGLYNPTSGGLDRQQGNVDISLITASGATTTQTSADQTNPNARGCVVVLDMTNVGTGSVTLEIDGKDPISGKYYAILTGAAVTTNSTNIYRVYPGLTASANATANDVLPRTWRVRVTANNANAATYTVGVHTIV